MSTATSQGQAFRPAPFPVFEHDTKWLAYRRARHAIAALVLFSFLVPFAAGPQGASSLEPMYLLLKLGERAPTEISINVPVAGFTVEPSLLGKFDDDGRFVYGAEICRGFVYGKSRDKVYILEIQAPQSTSPPVSSLLDDIRRQVDLLNDGKNLLRLERGKTSPNPTADSLIPRETWQKLTTGLEGAPPDEWAKGILESSAPVFKQVIAELGVHANHRARLKQIYYGTQQTRLDLLIAQFNLQLALARMPEREIPGLMSLGDSDLAQLTMLEEITRLREAWVARRDTLNQHVAADLQWLEDSGKRFAAANTRLDSFFSPQQQVELLDDWLPMFETDPGSQLEFSLIQARLRVANTELDAISTGLLKLDDSQGRVERGVLELSGLPAYTLVDSSFGVLEFEELDAYTNVVDIVQAGDAGKFIDHMACRVSGCNLCCHTGGDGSAHAWGFDPTPFELPYCMLALELSSHGSGGGMDFLQPGGTAMALDDDEPSPHEGIWQFVQWYASESNGMRLSPVATIEKPPDYSGAQSQNPNMSGSTGPRSRSNSPM